MIATPTVERLETGKTILTTVASVRAGLVEMLTELAKIEGYTEDYLRHGNLPPNMEPIERQLHALTVGERYLAIRLGWLTDASDEMALAIERHWTNYYESIGDDRD